MMKLLVGYDGSKCADAAIDDLVNAGLPEQGTALVVSVAEVWLPPTNGAADEENGGTNPYVEELAKHYRKIGEQAVAEAETAAKHGRERIRNILPGWDVQMAATYGSPAWEILNSADDFGPDLIVVGSQGKTGLSRFVLGSISQKVLSTARCSVRVGRGRIEVDSSPERIIVGFDGSEGSFAAADEVARRNWSQGSEVRLVGSGELAGSTTLGREWLEKAVREPLEKLKAVGLEAQLLIIPGNPKSVLVEEAEKWDADCIFVGANAAAGRLERFLIGSTSSAVASRADCSVEVVRRPGESPSQ
jgi:nucleotide-binding universal stress UspA family protein